jgi:Rad3-related DNA helicase
MKKDDLIELLNQIDANSEYSKLVIACKCEVNHYYRYDFIFESRHIAYIISNHSILVDALKELGDIDPRVASRIYLKSNFVDLGELDLIHSAGINYILE